jgi:arylsulfatase A-like enzyme
MKLPKPKALRTAIHLLSGACWLALAAPSFSAVHVDFAHSYTGASSATQNTGDVTLAFTVDGSGNVTLDASSVDPDPAAYINEFDGSVGTVSDPAMWGQSFSIVLSSTGVGNLRINNTGSGLAVQGGNSQVLDADASAANEVITATVTTSGTQFNLSGVDYSNLAGGVGMNVSGTTHTLSGSNGSVDVSAQGVTGNFTVASTGSAPGQGFVLSGLSFDLTGSLSASDVVVSFANSGTGFGDPTDARTIPWVSSGGAANTIALDFSIDRAGVVSLDASTNATEPLFQNMVAEWDNASVGSVADPALLNQSFTLTGTETGGTGGLTITEIDGGGIGVQGENSNRVDGLNYGSGGATSTPETLTWTLNAPAGIILNLVDWSHADGANGDIQVSDDTTGNDFPNLSGTSGSNTLTGLTLSDGDSLNFREIPGVGLTTGSAMGGFTFAIATPPVFDNDSGDNLWTTISNWKPDGLPVTPNDAIINGYDVILNSPVASGPAALKISDGSLTLRDTGTIAIGSMAIGENLESPVQLIMEGSTVSLGHTGSGVFAVGSAATVVTIPDNGGSSPLELDSGELVLEIGYQWILDGSDYTGSFTLGDQFVLANFGTLTGSTAGIRTRSFNLPPNRRLQLVKTASSIYYEVVAQTAATGPNIIIVNVDDMAGGQHFNFEGRDAITPTLDTLVSSGLRFTSASAASTVCGPSRYALMTSRWASRNTSAQFIARYPLGTLGRFAVADTELETDNQNLGAWLQQAGYRTGMVGKGHLTDDDLNQTANWAAKGLSTYPSNADPKTDATTNAKMQHNHRVLCQRMRAFGFDYVSSYYKANLAELRNDALNVHNQEWITKGALDFIDENHNERFFLYMAPTINHGPVRNDLSKTLGADNSYTSAGYLPNEDYSFMPTRQAIINEVNNGGKELISARETWLDYSIKAIVDKLTAHGIRNDTLIIFTSDHGQKDLNSTRAGQGPVVWGKSTLYDLGMRVPLVMNWPNGITSPGRSYDEIVSHVDIAPTLLALTGASSLPTRPVDGVSLVSVINGGSTAVRQDLFAEVGYARAVRTKDRKYIAVRYTPSVYTQISSGYLWEKYEGNTATGEFTEPRPYYVANSQLGSLASNSNPTYFNDDQLYNLTTDPTEDTNLYGQEPATAYDLKKRLASYIGGITNRPFRQFGDSSREFSPTPTSTPIAPGELQMQFLGLNSIQLDWTDSSNSELGYVVRKTVNGGVPEIIAELPAGSTSVTAALDSGIEDIVIEVASYNALGDTKVSEDLLSPESWRYRTFGDVDPTLSLPISQWNNDADSDGSSTIWEYAFGTDPRLASSISRPELRIGTGVGGPFLDYWLPRDRRRGLNFLGMVSSDLSASGWDKGAPFITVVEDEENHLLFRSATPLSDLTKQFIRAELLNPPGE